MDAAPSSSRTASPFSFMRALSLCLLLRLVLASLPAAPVEHLFDLPGNFRSPSDVAVATNGTVYVVDGLNHCIKSFDSAGKFLAAIGQKGSADGQFTYPLGLTVGASGKVYVADSGNHRIQIFDPAGQFLAKIDLPPRNGKPADPTDLVADEPAHACFIVDNDNHRLLHYDLQSLQLKAIHGTPGTKKQEFHYPFMIAQTRERDLCVVDVLNTRVQVLNPEGLFVAFIGDWGVDKGQFYRPKGIAIDDQDLVYVSDSYLGVVQIFDTTGRFLELVTDPDTEKVKKFTTPMGLCVDSQRRLYVVEMTLDRVGVFRFLKETKP
jgi:DNA-binding beta-propeller fold protein YncE